MQDRLSFLCLACGMRQPDAARCVGCREKPLGDLRTAKLRAEALAAFERSTRAHHDIELMRDTPEAVRAVFSFGLGGLLMTSPIAAMAAAIGGAPVAVLVLAVGGAAAMTVGEGLRRGSPRALVGLKRQRQLDDDVNMLVRSARRELAPPRSPEGGDPITLTGIIDGEPSESPFGSMALAERVAGELCGQPLDDAWVTGTRWTLRTNAEDRVGTEIDVTGGICILTSPTERLHDEQPSRDALEFLEARALTIGAGDWIRIRTTAVRAGDRVTITGVRQMESRPEGFRGSREQTVIAGPLSITRLARSDSAKS